MYVVAYETSSKTGKFLLDHALSMDNVCNRCLFSIPSKVEMAEEQEYLWFNLFYQLTTLIPVASLGCVRSMEVRCLP